MEITAGLNLREGYYVSAREENTVMQCNHGDHGYNNFMMLFLNEEADVPSLVK